MKTKFKAFKTSNPNFLVSSDINDWLENNPNIRVVRWSASPCGARSTRLVIEFEEIKTPKSSKLRKHCIDPIYRDADYEHYTSRELEIDKIEII